MYYKTTFAILVLIIALSTTPASAQTTSFTHHGNLGFSTNGNYDFELKLYDTLAPGSGSQQGAYINRPSGGSLLFREANATRMAINPGGTVSINVLGSAGSTQLCRNSSNQISSCSSSLRYKTNITPFSGGLSLVNRLQPITFNWKANGEADLGLGAEDVAKIEPLLVTLTNASTGPPLKSVEHDATLQGDGTSATPLGVAVPLSLSGSIQSEVILVVQNTANGGQGVRGVGGDDIGSGGTGFAGTGVGGRGGLSDSGPGGFGVSGTGGDSTSNTGGPGVRGRGGVSDSGTGGVGLFGLGGPSTSGSGGIGVVASGGGGPLANGLAGKFFGDVQVTGNLSKGGGSFKIDHPLDPENKYLYHSFVESPDMMNIYNGNAVTDANGDAVVEMPDYFEALNKEFRYQLTVIGTFAQAIVAEEITGNRFKIRTSAPNVKVSWQVTGIRHDAWANKNRIKVEVEKDERERGFYLHPELFNQPEERSIQSVRSPELMKQLKEAREQMKLKLQHQQQ